MLAMKTNVYLFPIKENIDRKHDRPHDGSSGGGNDGGDMIESRVARLESDVSHIRADINDIKTDIREIRKDMQSDFRMLFGVIIAVALGIDGLMAKGFHWL
jgi:hypothetical protein